MADGLIDKIRPTARDLVAAGIGAVGGAIAATKLPQYFGGFVERYQRRQAEFNVEAMQKAGQQGYAAAGLPQDVVTELTNELRQTREIYKSLDITLNKLNEKLGEK